ncbi:zinc finger MYM-type protein 1 [Trichonephila clavipes]|nr:zinc finger MYM-type protein 1 [Trichonephila clavipes]
MTNSDKTDIVQPEDINNALAEKYLENIGVEFENKVTWHLAIRGLAFRGTEEVLVNLIMANFIGALELLAKFNPFIREHIEQRELRPKLLPIVLSRTIYEIIEIMGKQIH